MGLALLLAISACGTTPTAPEASLDGPQDAPPTPTAASGLLAAFPQSGPIAAAEGFGASALANCRDKPLRVHRVKNTSASGSGSFHDIVENRLSDSTYDIVVFETGGTITLSASAKIVNSCVYVAGQTAPGGGIELRSPPDPGHQLTPIVFERNQQGHDVVIRYLRIRPGRGEPARADNIRISSGYNIVIDHVSTAWGNDESIGMFTVPGGRELEDVSVQWSMITTTLRPHSAGNLIGGNGEHPDVSNISVHHNAYIHNAHRNPLIKRVKCIEVANNVVYNWRARAGYTSGDACVDYRSNYFKRGPWSNSRVLGHQILNHMPEFTVDPRALHISGNIVDPDQLAPTAIQTDLTSYVSDRTGDLPSAVFRTVPSANPTIAVTLSSATSAYEAVLSEVGASRRLSCRGDWIQNRDEVDRRFIQDVRSGTGPSSDDQADHQDDYGGYVALSAGVACLDTDGDGMPDEFESRFGFDASSPEDAGADKDRDGYLNLEEYINGTTP